MLEGLRASTSEESPCGEAVVWRKLSDAGPSIALCKAVLLQGVAVNKNVVTSLGTAVTLLIVAAAWSVRCLAQSPGQLQCEREAGEGYQQCLAHGIPCVASEPNCGSHKGSVQQCQALYSSAYARCQASFSWTQVPAPANATWPQARMGAAYWTAKGTFWLFGGYGVNTPFYEHDFWKYVRSSTPVAAGVWTQVSNGAAGTPSGRMFAAFATDSAGDLWMFGGYGVDSHGNPGALNDLWKFSPASATWQLLAGSSANSPGVYPSTVPCVGAVGSGNPSPGGRYGALAWVDAKGNFWLFGGFALGCRDGALAYFNDLWEFSSSGGWTYVTGSALLGSNGTIPGTSTLPGGRAGGTAWTDANGNFWLMGGYGFDFHGNQGNLNDLWEYTGGGGWSLKAGSATLPTNSGIANGSYGTQATPSSSNVPPGRNGASTWTDPSGNLWLFAGTITPFGVPDTFPTESTLYGDLWEYKPSTGQWTWIAGPQGSMSGTPPARMGAVGWADGPAEFWIFGGYGMVAPPPNGYPSLLDDLWYGTGVVY